MEKRIEEPDKIINPDIGERVYLNIIKKRGRWIAFLSIALVISIVVNCILGVRFKQSLSIIDKDNRDNLYWLENYSRSCVNNFNDVVRRSGYRRMLNLEETRKDLEFISVTIPKRSDNAMKVFHYFDAYREYLYDWERKILGNSSEDIPREEEINNILLDLENIRDKLTLRDKKIKYEQIDFEKIIEQLYEETKTKEVKEMIRFYWKND